MSKADVGVPGSVRPTRRILLLTDVKSDARNLLWQLATFMSYALGPSDDPRRLPVPRLDRPKGRTIGTLHPLPVLQPVQVSRKESSDLETTDNAGSFERSVELTDKADFQDTTEIVTRSYVASTLRPLRLRQVVDGQSMSRIGWDTKKSVLVSHSRNRPRASAPALPLELCVDLGGAGVIADADGDRDWVGGALQDRTPPLGKDRI